MKVTLIGHSTLLIEAGGLRLLTDPFFASFMPAYKRIRRFERGALDAAPINAVLLSHGHFDHADIPYLLRLSSQTTIFCPKGYVGAGRRKKHLSAWESVNLGTATVTAVPARHAAPTIGFVVASEGKTIYFSGDTLLAPFLAEVGDRFELDAALIPVSGFRVPLVMGNQEAVRAVEMLRAPLVIPVHMDLAPRFPFMTTGETPETFRTLMATESPNVRIVLLSNGGELVI